MVFTILMGSEFAISCQVGELADEEALQDTEISFE